MNKKIIREENIRNDVECNDIAKKAPIKPQTSHMGDFSDFRKHPVSDSIRERYKNSGKVDIYDNEEFELLDESKFKPEVSDDFHPSIRDSLQNMRVNLEQEEYCALKPIRNEMQAPMCNQEDIKFSGGINRQNSILKKNYPYEQDVLRDCSHTIGQICIDDEHKYYHGGPYTSHRDVDGLQVKKNQRENYEGPKSILKGAVRRYSTQDEHAYKNEGAFRRYSGIDKQQCIRYELEYNNEDESRNCRGFDGINSQELQRKYYNDVLKQDEELKIEIKDKDTHAICTIDIENREFYEGAKHQYQAGNNKHVTCDFQDNYSMGIKPKHSTFPDNSDNKNRKFLDLDTAAAKNSSNKNNIIRKNTASDLKQTITNNVNLNNTKTVRFFKNDDTPVQENIKEEIDQETNIRKQEYASPYDMIVENTINEHSNEQNILSSNLAVSIPTSSKHLSFFELLNSKIIAFIVVCITICISLEIICFSLQLGSNRNKFASIFLMILFIIYRMNENQLKRRLGATLANKYHRKICLFVIRMIFVIFFFFMLMHVIYEICLINLYQNKKKIINHFNFSS